MAETIRFEDWEAERMQDTGFRAAAEELELSYQIARLRQLRGMTQQEVADLVGTKQPSIARLESGKVAPKLPFAQKVVEALGGRLVINVEPK